MRRMNLRKLAATTLALSASLLANGCTFDVKLGATPDTVQIGQPVNFDVTVTNNSNCPVGVPVAILIPFVPKDHLISKIDDDDFREFLSEAVDDFCTEGDLFEPPPGAEASCDFADGDLVCTMSGFGDIPLAPQANVAVNGGSKEQEVSCESDGGTITCRVPRALVEMAQEAGEQPQEGILDTLGCFEEGPIVICVGLALPPGGSATGNVELVIDEPGVYRNWVVAFPTVNDGVCSGGQFIQQPFVPCESGAPSLENCLFGGLGECLGGICVGDDDDDAAPNIFGDDDDDVGFGCNNFLGQGAGAGLTTCDCEECDDGLGVDIACTTVTASFSAPAPAMSTLGLAAMALALFAVAAAGLRRVRRQP